MFCNNCGTQLPDNANVCSNCGTPVNGGAQQPQYQQPVQPQYQQPVQPQYQQPVQPQYQQPVQPQYQQPVQPQYQQPVQPQYQQPYAAAPQGKQPAHGMAIAALVCGLVGLFFFPAILGCIATILGSVAKKKGNTSGIATGGMVLGIIDVAWYLLSLIICGGFMGIGF